MCSDASSTTKAHNTTAKKWKYDGNLITSWHGFAVKRKHFSFALVNFMTCTHTHLQTHTTHPSWHIVIRQLFQILRSAQGNLLCSQVRVSKMSCHVQLDEILIQNLLVKLDFFHHYFCLFLLLFEFVCPAAHPNNRVLWRMKSQQWSTKCLGNRQESTTKHTREIANNGSWCVWVCVCVWREKFNSHHITADDVDDDERKAPCTIQASKSKVEFYHSKTIIFPFFFSIVFGASIHMAWSPNRAIFASFSDCSSHRVAF